jgi:hypothetical protein
MKYLFPILFAVATAAIAAPETHKIKPSPCEAEDMTWGEGADPDIRIMANHDLFVMFHGNRFVAAKELVSAFEGENPSVKLSFTAIPPVNTLVQSIGREADFLQLRDAGKPDVVMLPIENFVKFGMNDKFNEPQKYSSLQGMIMLFRRTDDRIGDPATVLNDANVRVVLPAGQLWDRLVYKGPASALGVEALEKVIAAPQTVFSQMKHHRSVPARIVAGCGDVGFQYVQSQRYIEDRFPGVFKFVHLPILDKAILAEEDSYVATSKTATNPELAERFKAFMLSPTAQSILKKYRTQL